MLSFFFFPPPPSSLGNGKASKNSIDSMFQIQLFINSMHQKVSSFGE